MPQMLPVYWFSVYVVTLSLLVVVSIMWTYLIWGESVEVRSEVSEFEWKDKWVVF